MALFRTFTLLNIWHYDTLGAEGARDVSGLAPCAPSTPHLSYALMACAHTDTSASPHELSPRLPSTSICTSTKLDSTSQEAKSQTNRVSRARGPFSYLPTPISLFPSSKLENLHCNCYPTHSEVDYLDHERYYSFINENI